MKTQNLAELSYHLVCLRSLGYRNARERGLAPRECELLPAIKTLPPDRRRGIGELADWLHMQHHGVVELATRLQRRGLLRRYHDQQDGRQARLALTAPRQARVTGFAGMGKRSASFLRRGSRFHAAAHSGKIAAKWQWNRRPQQREMAMAGGKAMIGEIADHVHSRHVNDNQRHAQAPPLTSGLPPAPSGRRSASNPGNVRLFRWTFGRAI